MAKKPKKEAVKPTEEKGTLTAAKEAVVKAAEKVAGVVSQAAQAVKGHVVVEPVVKAVKPKKKRFVREKKDSKPQDHAPAMPKPSKKVAAKLMSKGLVVPPKEDPQTSQKPRA